MTKQFYNHVARKFGGYNSKAKYKNDYPEGRPDDIFKKRIVELGGEGKTALDLGCGDGRFTAEIAPAYKKVTGIDQSEEMLRVAGNLKSKLLLENISFEVRDAENTKFPNNSFDVIYSRRGPTPFKEIGRILKPGGYFVEINIGEKNGVKLKEVFGRGQNFELEDDSFLEKHKSNLVNEKFQIIFSKDYRYAAYFEKQQDLDLFLQGSPLIDAFDSEKDKIYLEKYATQFQTKKGIKLARHLLIVVAQKLKGSK